MARSHDRLLSIKNPPLRDGNRKQEIFARTKAHDRLIGLERLIEAYEHGCGSRYEMAAFLDVTEEFLEEALERYRNRYGDGVKCGKYTVRFEPRFEIQKGEHTV